MNAIQMILVVIVAFFAGMGGILDEFQFHQPLVACTLIGLVTGNLTIGIMLGGSLQMIALGWANIGAAVAPAAVRSPDRAAAPSPFQAEDADAPASVLPRSPASDRCRPSDAR